MTYDHSWAENALSCAVQRWLLTPAARYIMRSQVNVSGRIHNFAQLTPEGNEVNEVNEALNSLTMATWRWIHERPDTFDNEYEITYG